MFNSDKIRIIALYTGIVIVAITLAIGGWYLERDINYSIEYKNKVIETIKEQVKPSCLINREE